MITHFCILTPVKISRDMTTKENGEQELVTTYLKL